MSLRGILEGKKRMSSESEFGVKIHRERFHLPNRNEHNSSTITLFGPIIFTKKSNSASIIVRYSLRKQAVLSERN